MPTVDFEVVATDCQLAGEILDVGIEAYTAARDSATAYNYICVGNASLSPSPSQIFLSFYIVGLIPTLIGWAILYRQGRLLKSF